MAKTTNQFELALSVFYYRNPILLNNQLNCKLSDIQLEKRYENRNVDMYAVDSQSNTEVYVEYQLTPSDNVHSKQIQAIIDSEWSRKHIKVVWVATEFKEEYVAQIKKCVNASNKQIEFHALALNQEVIEKIKLLDLKHTYEDGDSIDSLNEISSHFREVYVIKNYEMNTSDNIVNIHSDFKKQLLEQVITEMRKQMSWYIPCFLTKSVQGNRFSLGSGVSDIIYVVGINRHNALYVQITFAKNKLNVYKKVKESKDEIDDALEYRTYWDDAHRRVNTTYLLQGHIENNVKETARLLDRYVRCFNKYI